MLHRRRIKVVELLISQGFITEKQLSKIIDEQKKTGREIGALVVEMGYITHSELTSLLGEQIQMTTRKRIGEVLIDQSMISPEQLKDALDYQRTSHETLGQCLVQLKFIDEDSLLDVLAAQLDTPHVVLDHIVFNHKMLELIPITYMEEYKIVPLFLRRNQLTIAMSDPSNLRTRDHLRFTTGKDIDPVLASEASIDQFIRKLKDHDIQEVNRPLDTMERVDLDDINEAIEISNTSEYGEVVVNIVNNLVFEAIYDKASDIHIEDMHDHVRIRFRIDGTLVEKRTLEHNYLAPIISRLKILSNLDISEKRKPQDGKFHIHHDKHFVDIRVSTFPIISQDRGLKEKAVLRILDAESSNMNIDDIGFPPALKKSFLELIHHPNGIILLSGPTGSGKSTTLYASLKALLNTGVNIITMEDPVEYTIEGIAQGQIFPKSGFTFASGMRSILRQDPDIIMVGEMRDIETCEMAIQAALTGHMVFSTLHTNDAPSAITRLLDLDIEPYLISSSIKGIMAQRLVRRICKNCIEEYIPDQELKDHFGYDLPDKLHRGTGCSKCNNTGYYGRAPIFELLIPDESIESMIMKRCSAGEIRKHAIQSGLMGTLRHHGFQLIKEGITTVDEVMMKTERDVMPVPEAEDMSDPEDM